jgi:hypothetical protein
MSLVLGKFEPRIVIKKTGVSDETIDVEQQSEDSGLTYDPDFVSHELQNRSLVRKLHGFRFRAQLEFPIVDGTELIKFARLLHQITVNGTPGYDEIWFYPCRTEKPNYYERVTIDDETIRLAWLSLIAHKDFSLTFIGLDQVDWVPLAPPDFTMWGTVSMTIQSITQTFAELT